MRLIARLLYALPFLVGMPTGLGETLEQKTLRQMFPYSDLFPTDADGKYALSAIQAEFLRNSLNFTDDQIAQHSINTTSIGDGEYFEIPFPVNFSADNSRYRFASTRLPWKKETASLYTLVLQMRDYPTLLAQLRLGYGVSRQVSDQTQRQRSREDEREPAEYGHFTHATRLEDTANFDVFELVISRINYALSRNKLPGEFQSEHLEAAQFEMEKILLGRIVENSRLAILEWDLEIESHTCGKKLSDNALYKRFLKNLDDDAWRYRVWQEPRRQILKAARKHIASFQRR